MVCVWAPWGCSPPMVYMWGAESQKQPGGWVQGGMKQGPVVILSACLSCGGGVSGNFRTFKGGKAAEGVETRLSTLGMILSCPGMVILAGE